MCLQWTVSTLSRLVASRLCHKPSGNTKLSGWPAQQNLKINVRRNLVMFFFTLSSKHCVPSRKLKCPSCREGVPVEVMDRRGVVRGAPSRGGKGERGGGGALHPGPRQQTLEPHPTCPPCPPSLSKGQTLSQVARLLVMKVTTPSQPSRMLLVVERL